MCWANDVTVRQMARNRRNITAADHARWFSKSLSDPMRRIYVAVADNSPVGQIRLDRQEDSAQVDISTDRQWRAGGVGSYLLTNPILWDWPGLTKLWADVRTENTASTKLFKSAGFIMTSRSGAFLHFEKHE